MTPDGRTLYVATAGADRVSVIRTDTGTLTHSVPVGGGPTALAFAPDGRHLYVSHLTSDDVPVISTRSRTVTDTIAVGDGPNGLAVAPDGCTVHVGKGPSPRGGPSAYRQSRSRASTAEL
ncbi:MULTISPECIES: YncE family protein [Streptomyces]|uniref:YncE family protein n=1 Tax=Streptomyces TaxID=1883 RepID=UPI0029CD62A7|nr:beta-propeller fold lactonase family protein [Streptomyces sp. F8]MDX6760437.1 beta-propeller fold lactonase family protein [Streptomyces sp. F8]